MREPLDTDFHPDFQESFFRQGPTADMVTVILAVLSVPLGVTFLMACLYIAEAHGEQILALLERFVS